MNPARRDDSDEDDEPRSGTAERAENGQPRQETFWGGRVLVVDDEPGAARLAATYLERLLDGVDVVTATGGDEALARFEGASVDCVVSDYDMPGRNGLELLRDVRSTDCDVPFVLFTGKGSEEIASEAISAGVTDYLQKGTGPDQYEMLANRVANALQRRRAETALGEINRKVTAIHELATELSNVETVTEVYECVVAASEEILEFDRCITARRDGDHVVPAVLSASVDEDEVRRFEVGKGVVGRTAAEGRTFVIDDLHGDDGGEAESVAEPVADDIRSAISVPIGTFGVFQAVSSGRAEFDESDVEFAELVCSHARDAIERIRTETALRTERDRLAALFENVPLPIARIVIGPDGTRRLDATNEAFEETFGRVAGEVASHEVFDRIVPTKADRDRPEDARDAGHGRPEETRETDRPVRTEVERLGVEGVREYLLHVIPTSGSEETLIYAVYADIDEQKRVERTLHALHESTREMFRAERSEGVARVATRAAIDIIGFPNSGVRLYDPETGTLKPTAISREATDAIGERPPFGPGDGLIWDAFETGESAVVSDLDEAETAVGYGDLRSLVVIPLGEHGVLVLGSREPAFFDDSDAQLARVLGANVTVALDRSDRIERLRQRDEELKREIERLERFSGVVSHDLRNPLNVATGRLELARAGTDDPETLDQLEGVAEAHDRMAGLIDDLLTLAREGRSVDAPEPTEIGDVATRAWETVETHDATLTTVDCDGIVEADPERIRTLLENLFRNAVEHGGPAVTVSVSTTTDGFAVADDGPGFEIDPERAMEYGVSGRDRGSGFGLAIVREIATAHGWELRAENDGGARFVFRTA